VWSDVPDRVFFNHEQVAMRAAREGGAVMSEKVGAEVIKTKANARDLLTEVDGEVQRIIERHVAEAFPMHGFLVRTNRCIVS
jgi:myo-inositol-1(or 4)-monophosphatase